MNKQVKIDDNLIELVKSVRNRCEVLLIIFGMPEAKPYLATLLEDMGIDMQEILEYCVEVN